MKAPGKIVKVNDTYMHVCCVSEVHENDMGTIVFLAGSGTECPTYDFKPLWNLLAGKFNMAVVERPGYGWSGITKYPRDIDTILEETKEALKKANVGGPYIPAAHSLSGLEAIYWAQKYPDEVSAIIGLDMVVPKAYDTMKAPKTLPLLAKVGHLLSGPIAKSMVKSHPVVKMGLLDEKEQAAMKYIVSKQLLSENMLDEIKYVRTNAKKITNGKCPQVPVLCCLSTDKGILKSVPAWGEIQRDYFKSNSRAQIIELACGHYVHREEPKILAKTITQFLRQIQITR